MFCKLDVLAALQAAAKHARDAATMAHEGACVPRAVLFDIEEAARRIEEVAGDVGSNGGHAHYGRPM